MRGLGQRRPRRATRRTAALAALLATGMAAAAGPAQAVPEPGTTTLRARAVLPAQTFAGGPPTNGFPSQPVQGISGLVPLDAARHRYLALSDNGFGAITNSEDYLLRAYELEVRANPRGDAFSSVEVLGFRQLRDPGDLVPFTIVNELTDDRLLTGADFDPESIQVAPDGTIWVGEEFGPFVLHFSADGVLLEAPIALPDFSADPGGAGPQVRAPQNPGIEEGTVLRVANALRAHAQANGSELTPIISSDANLLRDANPATNVASRRSPPAGSGLEPASSEIVDVAQLQAAGFTVVPYTVNARARMDELLRLGVDGLISDSPEVLYDAVAAFDANGDGTPGDYLLADGRIDPAQFDAQGHRGARNLRPENTLPAFEAALDELMNTLETDSGVTSDGVAVLSHDPFYQSEKCRRADGAPYTEADELLIRDHTAAELQAALICDDLLPGRPTQTNDPALSPVTAAYAAEAGLPSVYTPPTLDQLLDFVDFYAAWFETGPGADDPDAAVLAANARAVRFNVETKRNPRPEFVDRTVGPQAFVEVVGGTLVDAGVAERSTLQSFDWSTLLAGHETFPELRTVALLGDFPIFDDPTVPGSDEGTNLQPDESGNTPWLAGFVWPYRETALDYPVRAASSGGFEGMALSPDGTTLYPLLEKPLAGDAPGQLLIHALDIATSTYTGERWTFPLGAGAVAIGDFQLYADTRGALQGVIIERDNSNGDVNGVKRVVRVELGAPGTSVGNEVVADLNDIRDPFPERRVFAPGDIGIGTERFSFPFVTIESVVVLSPTRLLVANDNNFPGGGGRHPASPDDTELIRIRIDPREALTPARSRFRD